MSASRPLSTAKKMVPAENVASFSAKFPTAGYVFLSTSEISLLSYYDPV